MFTVDKTVDTWIKYIFAKKARISSSLGKFARDKSFNVINFSHIVFTQPYVISLPGVFTIVNVDANYKTGLPNMLC